MYLNQVAATAALRSTLLTHFENAVDLLVVVCALRGIDEDRHVELVRRHLGSCVDVRCATEGMRIHLV